MEKSILAVVVIVGLALFFLVGSRQKSDWTLMICKTVMANNADCYTLERTLPGFSTLEECQKAGLATEKTFECGKGCKASTVSTVVCDPVCNNLGCS